MGTISVGAVIEYRTPSGYQPLLLAHTEAAGIFAEINEGPSMKSELQAELDATAHPWTRTQHSIREDTLASTLLCTDLAGAERAVERRRQKGKSVPPDFDALLAALRCLGEDGRIVFWWEQS